MSKSKIQRICIERLKSLPSNNIYTFENCNKFSQVLMPDAKYINVRGRENKLAFLWAVDYFKHDFPFIYLAPSESFQSWNKFFNLFKMIDHQPQIVVCDDHTGMKAAARRQFRSVRIQACFNHLKENLRRRLRIRSESTYREFFRDIEYALDSKENLPKWLIKKRLRYAYYKWQDHEELVRILLEIASKEDELYSHKWIRKSPKTTNLIEAFNSHLEARLKAIRSFNSYQHADLWLNGYVLKRRFTKFTDCSGKFKHLNGFRPIEMTKFESKELQEIF